MTGGDQLRLSTIIGGNGQCRNLMRKANSEGCFTLAGRQQARHFIPEHRLRFGRAGRLRKAVSALAPGLGLTNKVIH